MIETVPSSELVTQALFSVGLNAPLCRGGVEACVVSKVVFPSDVSDFFALEEFDDVAVVCGNHVISQGKGFGGGT